MRSFVLRQNNISAAATSACVCVVCFGKLVASVVDVPPGARLECGHGGIS